MDLTKIYSMMFKRESAARDLSKTLLKLTECPKCNKDSIAEGSVFCENGHTICTNCVNLEEKTPCPKCDVAITKHIKNYALEDISKTLKDYIVKHPETLDDGNAIQKDIFNIYAGLSMILSSEELNECKFELSFLRKELKKCQYNLEISTVKLAAEIENCSTLKERLRHLKKSTHKLKGVLNKKRKNKNLTEASTSVSNVDNVEAVATTSVSPASKKSKKKNKKKIDLAMWTSLPYANVDVDDYY